MARPSNIRERVRELRDAGVDPQSIARVLNVTASAVYYHLANFRTEEAEQANLERLRKKRAALEGQR